MLNENDAKSRATTDLVALLTVARKYVPGLQEASSRNSRLDLWSALNDVMDRSDGMLRRLSKARRVAVYRALIDAGLVRRLVSIVVDFAHLEKVSTYMTQHTHSREKIQRGESAVVSFSGPTSTWLYAVSHLGNISRKPQYPDPIVPLAEWRKYGAQLVAAYRASELSSPVQGQTEHEELSMVRLTMIDSLGDILQLNNLEPIVKPNEEDILIMKKALPLLFDLLSTFQSPPTLQVSRYLVMTLLTQLISVLTSLAYSAPLHEVSTIKLSGYSLRNLIHVCAAPIDDSLELSQQRLETLICLQSLISFLPKEKAPTDPEYATGHITGLLQPLIETHLMTRFVHLIRDIRDHPELFVRGSMKDGRPGEVFVIDSFVSFLWNVQIKCGLQHLKLVEELAKTDFLFLLEWWSLTAPPDAVAELGPLVNHCLGIALRYRHGPVRDIWL
ncbi:hypothetical protein DL93DRAFT_2230070, partial [Clavulina sp. PMI_390]